MLKLRQKTFTNDEGKKIAFVDIRIVDGKYDYPVRFDDKTKKRANQWMRSLGFTIGEINEDLPEKEVTI